MKKKDSLDSTLSELLKYRRKNKKPCTSLFLSCIKVSNKIPENILPSLHKFQLKLFQNPKQSQQPSYQCKRMYLRISQKWFDQSLKHADLHRYFLLKDRAKLVIKFEEYLKLILKESNQINLEELKQIHAFGVPSLLYSVAKSIMFTAIHNERGNDSRSSSKFGQRMELIRLAIVQVNELFAVCPLKTIMAEIKKLALRISDIVLEQLLFFLFQCSGLEGLINRVKACGVRLSSMDLLKLKIELVKICHRAGTPLGILHRLVDNFKFLKPLLLCSTTTNEYLEDRFGSLHKFMEETFLQLPITEGLRKQQRHMLELIAYHFFSTQNYCFSTQEIHSIISPDLSYEMTERFCVELLKHLRLKHRETYLYCHTRCEIKKLLSFYKQDSREFIIASRESKLRELNEMAQKICFKNRFQSKFCTARSQALIASGVHLYDTQQLIKLHQSIGVKACHVQLYEQFATNSSTAKFFLPHIKKLKQGLL